MQINKYAIKHKILPFWSTMYKQRLYFCVVEHVNKRITK